jgi:hypothetical protein
MVSVSPDVDREGNRSNSWKEETERLCDICRSTVLGLEPGLEAIATALAERLRANLDADMHGDAELQRDIGVAAIRAISPGLSLGVIAGRHGQTRAREELGGDGL